MLTNEKIRLYINEAFSNIYKDIIKFFVTNTLRKGEKVEINSYIVITDFYSESYFYNLAINTHKGVYKNQEIKKILNKKYLFIL
ncbi:MAG: hypothetical protein KatS3mg068_1285 [Candidatus Sericytochromatia bacterium]|nr:MAG: hypothetical protein KatS3mg068_1285 [Candidatus Sericytochromatia bacterium]